jgi:Toxin SymE, type I toxin-antitoxin system
LTLQTLTITGRAPTGTPLAPEVPHLELSGRWLLAAGFPVGSRVRVEEVEPGLLVLSRAPEGPDERRELLPLVWVPAEQIGRLEAAGRCGQGSPGA